MFRHSHSPRVPAASYLEEQAYHYGHMRQQSVPVEMAPPPLRENPHQAEHRQRLAAAAQRNGTSFRTVPSKAYLEDMEDREEAARRSRSHSSRHPPEIPVKTPSSRAWRPGSEVYEHGSAPQEKKAPAKPLKPALKKSSTYTPTPALKSALKPTAYHSDNEGVETGGRRSESRRNESRNGITVMMQPSKAFLEDQEERLNANRSKPRPDELAPVPVRALRDAPVHEIPASAFVSDSSSGSSGSSDSSVDQEREYRRSRRVSQSSQHEGRQPVIQPSSYTQPYIKPQAEQTPRMHHHATPMQHSQSLSSRHYSHVPHTPVSPPSHPTLTWPLLEYDGRRRLPHPLLYFDAGLDPTRNKYALKVKRGPMFTPLSDQDRLLPATDPPTNEAITIVNAYGLWPFKIPPSKPGEILTVYDVFIAIFKWYSVPLTKQDQDRLGHDYLRRCESAFRDRVRRDVTFDHEGEAKGMLRIDVFMGRRLFKGLTPNTTSGYPRCFQIHFDDVPPQ
ncbi:hypothetical protein CVT24_003710 [Panaeolus cyanescens]|uniref:DUF6699 domain-containing protein n=1 Tax=Panaeolus cyanescens TaxID=181874 RepID=A0A409YXN8_9AGAR|nr:hypothetical protein CVT24_003710 [Panaeolus cyanescens]